MRYVISYARTSGESGDSVSIASQHKANGKLAEANQLGEVQEVSEMFTGTKINRPELDKILPLIRRRQVTAFIVYTADRLARMGWVAEYLYHEVFRPAGVRLFLSYSNREVTNTPEALLQFGIENDFAAYERGKIVERLARGKAGQLEEGIWVGEGTATKYGYAKVGTRRSTTLEIVPDEAETVRLIFRLYLTTDKGAVQVAEELNARGIPSPAATKGVLWMNTGKWDKQAIYRTLKEDAYTGVWYANRYKRVDGKVIRLPKEEWTRLDYPHLAIISQADFDAARRKLDVGRSVNAPPSKHPYLLGRRFRCQCGYGLVGAIKGSWKRTKYPYYLCVGRDERRSDCQMPYFRADRVDARAWEIIQSFLTNPTFRRETIDSARLRQIDANREALEALASVERIRARTKDQIGRLTDLYTDGLISKGEFKEKRAALDKQLAGADSVEAEYRATMADYLSEDDAAALDAMCEKLARVFDKLGDLDHEKRLQLVQAMGITAEAQTLQDGGAMVLLYARGQVFSRFPMGDTSSVVECETS